MQQKVHLNKNKKAVMGWAIYDWANSAFATTVMSGFFPIFFKQYWSFGVDVNTSTARLGLGNAAAGLVVAMLAPVLGAIADRGGTRKKMLVFFAYLGVLSTALLYLVEKGMWQAALFIYAMGIIGFSGSNIFYDSLLPDVSDDHNMDFVSGAGYALGYLGGGILFVFNTVMVSSPELFHIPDAATAVKLSFLTVALWWGGFTLFTLKWIKDEPRPDSKSGIALVSDAFKELKTTFLKIRRMKPVFLFLLAYWFYIDGVGTIIRMAVDYGISLGFDSTELIKALIIVQFVGFPAALVFGKLGQWWDTKKSIYLGIGIYMVITVIGATINEKSDFYLLAILVGLSQGGIQALSRSYYARLIPKNQPAEFFGFYNMMGKFAAILGPMIVGLAGLFFRNLLMPVSPTPQQMESVGRMASRLGISSIMILFIAGAVLLFFVDETKGDTCA